MAKAAQAGPEALLLRIRDQEAVIRNLVEECARPGRGAPSNWTPDV